MIPKIINYCWFGGAPLSELALECVESWKKYCPDYEIVEWNELNFDLNCCEFVKEAYQARKWAYVSDYARLKIIYDNGGIYLDTDVKLIKSLDDLLSENCFFGAETSGYVATGLGFGAVRNSSVVKMLLMEYSGKHFKLSNGNYDMEPCPIKNTRPLFRQGYKYSSKEIWKGSEVTVFPPEYFCPLNYQTKQMVITDKTFSIHLYNASWHSRLDKVIAFIEGESSKGDYDFRIRRCISFPFRIVNKINNNGIRNTLKFILSRLK